MRTNRIYRAKANEKGKTHLFNSGSADTPLVAALCGTEISITTAPAVKELRGIFLEEDGCGRCRRALDRVRSA